MELPEVEIKKILYATDLSENARQAFAYAASLADLCSARLLILHVIFEDPDLEEKVRGYVSAEQWDRIKSQHLDDARESLIGKRRDHMAIRDVLNTFCRREEKEAGETTLTADEIIVERGHPVDQIVRIADGKNVDLIVMGRHGYSGLKDALMGGVARGVLRRSTKPVLLVKLPED